MLVPSERAHIDAHAHVLHFGGLAEGIETPSVFLHLRDEPQRRHLRMRRDHNERAAAVVYRAHEAHGFGVARVGAGEDHKTKSARAQQFIRRAHRIRACSGTHEQRPFIPERAGNGARAIDPRGAVAVGEGGVTRRAQHGRDAAVWFAHGNFS